MKKLSFFLISLGLAVVLSFTASWQLLYNIKLQHDVNKLEVSSCYFDFNLTDYNAALSLTQNMVFQQDENYLTVDTMTMLYISPQAIADCLANNQDERFLGIDTDTLYYYEASLDNTAFYYIDGNGEMQVLPIPPDPNHNLFRIIMSAVQIAAGGILLCTGVGGAAGAWMIASGISGLISEFFMEEIGQLFEGMSSIITGLNCLMVGISLLSCNPFGIALGVSCLIVGGATALVGINDIGTVLTGVNLIQTLTGMSDSAYMWMKMGLNVASTILTITASIGKAKGWFEKNSFLSPDAKNALNMYDKNNWTHEPGYANPHNYNNVTEPKLPNSTTYKTYDITKPIPGIGRGAERFVLGADGTLWYTPEHYKIWFRVR